MTDRKEATRFTEQANSEVLGDSDLDWTDSRDFDFANRGLVSRVENLRIEGARGRTVWSLDDYAFLEQEEAPPSVNPSLWRQARLNMIHGLFQIHERIYQVRGHDLSVVTFLVGDSGLIVIDPLISAETARSALALVTDHLGDRPVVAVIYTHCHVDHYGGVEGVTTRENVAAGRVRVLAPEGFTDAAISENVIAGNVMTRRAMYMYGNLLPKDEKGQVDAGLGKTTSMGSVSLIEPTESIVETGTTKNIDGIEITFQVTPDTEAPAEMNFFFPQFNVLCMAENCSHNQHNLYTLRGAQVRDARAWSHYMNESLELFADRSDLVFTSHHWPVWGKSLVREYLTKQRDMYRYLHDQTLRLANHGLTMDEIAEEIELPPSLAGEWYNRSYYGSVNHNSKAVYQRYLGFFDGNPSNLHRLPPEEAGKKYVELAGGPNALLDHAREAFEQGQYRWVAEVTNHLVFADPANAEARNLAADALEQLGYQAEPAPWRNFYLTGAQELRAWVPRESQPSRSAPASSIVRSMSLERLFDYLAVRLNGPDAEGKRIAIDLELTDTGERAGILVENCVLNASIETLGGAADAALALTRPVLNEIVLGRTSLSEKIEEGQAAVNGDAGKIEDFLSLLDRFDRHFAIVTP